MKILSTFTAIFFMFIQVNLAAAFVTVGTDNDCDFNNLDAAYVDSDAFVRVTTQQQVNLSLTIIKAKWIIGGYDTCADADSGNLGFDKTAWSYLASNDTVIKINANLATIAIVVIDNFDIHSGQDLSATGAGGIRVEGNSNLILNNSIVRNSLGQYGGGIHVSGPSARTTLNNTVVRNNGATIKGGGIYCDNQATVAVLGNSSIKSNGSNSQGGGIFATSSCQVSIESGDSNPITGSFDNLGIVNNEAVDGGGIYLESGADLTLSGNDDHPASIIGNYSTGVMGQGGAGAGLYLDGNSTSVTAINARIESNVAGSVGGGVYTNNNAQFTMRRLDTPCWDNDKCSSLSKNISSDAGYAGALSVGLGVVAEVSQTYISENKAVNTSLFVLSSDSQLTLEGNLIVGNIGYLGSATAQDLFLITGSNGAGATLNFLYNTLADNDATTVFNIEGTTTAQTINVNNSIIWEQGDIVTTTGAANHNATFDCLFVNEFASLVGTINITNTSNPQFIDAINGDYHLANNSRAIDYCDEVVAQGQYNDLNGNSRGFDVTEVNNVLGSYDAGAYEVSTQVNPDIIFQNGFE